MSAIVKPKLRAAKEAIGKKDYAKAKDLALNVLEYEPENYTAHVFLGVAYLELGDAQLSEQICLKATAIQPDQVLAWQGLSKLYEKSENWKKYVDVLNNLAPLFLKSNDATKCAETLQKLIECRRKNGTPMELADALTLLLPDSAYYALLSELPPPDATNPSATTTFVTQSAIHNSLPIIEEIVVIVETHDNNMFSKEVEKRRQRLGAAGPEAVKREVGKEVWGSSKLPGLYQEIIGHPTASDDLRRSTEAKLLQHKQQLLYALSSKDDAILKKQLSEEVRDMVSGIVLLNIPNELAWNLHIEGTDAASIEEYDLSMLFRYVRLFPASALAKLLSAYLSHCHLNEAEADESNGKHEEPTEDDFASVIIDTFPNCQHSVLAHRIVAQVYQDEEDLENAVRAAENGLELVRREEQNRAIKLPRVRLGLNVILGTALTDLFPPKHHTRALRIIDDVLSDDRENVRCLMSRGFILQYAKRWEDACSIFLTVTKLLPEDVYDGLRAEEEAAWCYAQNNDPDGGSSGLQKVLAVLDYQEGRELDKARCWWRLGKCQWDLGDPTSREAAYKSFITSLKRLPTFASAFTSLGIYYSEFFSPPDPTRASKCFQKAFELDPREAEAARRLAEAFAEEREWDLVEVVARRTIEGEGGFTGGLDNAATSRFQPLNAWAWKALGIVELTRHRYTPAITALQVALRSDPNDPILWLRLGEAYTKAARLAAALKALERARELSPSDWKCSYFLGDVHRQSGQYQHAIDTFASILLEVPSELTVLLALAQTHLEYGRTERSSGFSARAESSFLSAINVVLSGLDASPGFRRIAWKTAADALYELSQLSAYSDDKLLISVLKKTVPLVTASPLERLSSVLTIPPVLADDTFPSLSRFALETSLCAYSYRVSLGSLDKAASASSWYDLGVALGLYANRSIDSSKHEHYNEEAIRCLKESIALAPSDDRYWNALAGAFFTGKPRLAQHAYVRALELDAKNFVTWTNLGLFYLYHSDTELAKEAFNKAQVLDPDFALAWAGQGALAVALGHQEEATALFEHAVGLATPVPAADVAFARRSFHTFTTTSGKHGAALDTLFPAFFVLDRYTKQRPEDATGLHLFGLVCECVNHLDLGIISIEKALALLEAAYEDSEDPVIEKQFTTAQINMARLRLSSGAYAAALDSYNVAIGLLAEPEDLDSAALLAQAHIGSGLAYWKSGDSQAAIASLEAASEAAADTPQLRDNAIVLLAQILWSLGTEEGQEAAKAHLLQSIDSNPDNLMAINTLAGMGILTDDDSLIDAALSEILALPVDERHERDPGRDITYLLVQHHLGQSNIREALSVAQKAVVHEPSRSTGREQLARLAFQRDEATSAEAILQSTSIPPREALALRAVAGACLGASSAKSQAAKAVFWTPWERRNWQALAYCCSKQQL